MVEASVFFDAGQKLTSIFGEWPSFHDAEVTDVHLWRGDVKAGDWDDSNVFPVLTIEVRILEATQPGAVGDSGRDVLAKLRFHDVDDLKIEGFNHQNAILGISIAARDRGTLSASTHRSAKAWAIESSSMLSQPNQTRLIICGSSDRSP